ncbi:MAG: hypothetical protein HZC02_04145 [Candidatus Levybacteria bacterium]|nr:hypothetical protein [Candidatus Levybacteria bacterium]
MNEKVFYNIEAEFGPWRPVGPDEVVDPKHVDVNPFGVQVVPTRICGRTPDVKTVLTQQPTKLYIDGD